MLHEKHTSSTHAFIDTIDAKVSQYANKHNIIKKLENMSVVKDILGSKLVQDANKKVAPYVATIIKVLGVLAIISGALGILSALGLFSSGLFGFAPVRMILLFVVMLAVSLTSLLVGLGFVMRKKRSPYMLVISTVVQIGGIIVLLLLVGRYGSSNMSTIVGLGINICVLLLVLKNTAYFDK